MLTLQGLKALVQQRLSAAVDEVFVNLEKTFTEYEEEIRRQRRLLDMLTQNQTQNQDQIQTQNQDQIQNQTQIQDQNQTLAAPAQKQVFVEEAPDKQWSIEGSVCAVSVKTEDPRGPNPGRDQNRDPDPDREGQFKEEETPQANEMEVDCAGLDLNRTSPDLDYDRLMLLVESSVSEASNRDAAVFSDIEDSEQSPSSTQSGAPSEGLRLKVKLGEVLKEVTLTELSLTQFLKTAFVKFGVAAVTEGVRVRDSSGTEIDEDVFEEVVRNPSIGVLTVSYDAAGPGPSQPCPEAEAQDGPTTLRQMLDEEAKRLVEAVLTQKPGGDHIISEYSRTQSLADETRRKLVNILAADMTDKYGTSPSRQVKEMYARGIVSFFPFLRDPFSKNGFEHFYDGENGSGYLSWRIKTIQRSHAKDRRSSCGEGPFRKRQRLDEEAKQLVALILSKKPVGAHIISEYNQTQTLSDETRRKLVNVLAADMTDKYGTFPSRQVKETYARGIVSFFPFLRDPLSKNGFEHFYNSVNSSGYLAWRIKLIQKSATKNRRFQVPAESPAAEDSGLGSKPDSEPVQNLVPEAALSEAEYRQALNLMNRTTDEDTVRRTMKKTFVQRRNLVLDPNQAQNLLLEFPRFTDVKGLIEQDFALMFGDDVSGKLLERWPTTFKKKVIEQSRNLPSVKEFTELLQAADPPEDLQVNFGYDTDLASILLLLHLIPPTAQGRKKPGKVSASQAQKHLVVFEKPGTTLQQHLSRLGPSSEPYLLALDPDPQRFFVVFRGGAVPCWSRSSLGAFDELFKAHFVFGASFHPMLSNMYRFIQTTVFNIDVGKVKESPRVAEVRARLLN